MEPSIAYIAGTAVVWLSLLFAIPALRDGFRAVQRPMGLIHQDYRAGIQWTTYEPPKLVFANNTFYANFPNKETISEPVLPPTGPTGVHVYSPAVTTYTSYDTTQSNWFIENFPWHILILTGVAASIILLWLIWKYINNTKALEVSLGDYQKLEAENKALRVENQKLQENVEWLEERIRQLDKEIEHIKKEAKDKLRTVREDLDVKLPEAVEMIDVLIKFLTHYLEPDSEPENSDGDNGDDHHGWGGDHGHSGGHDEGDDGEPDPEPEPELGPKPGPEPEPTLPVQPPPRTTETEAEPIVESDSSESDAPLPRDIEDIETEETKALLPPAHFEGTMTNWRHQWDGTAERLRQEVQKRAEVEQRSAARGDAGTNATRKQRVTQLRLDRFRKE